MAVYPDRIVLKSSTDPASVIESMIGTGGTDAIIRGELVLALEEDQALLYTKGSTGAIVPVGDIGAKDSRDLDDVNTGNKVHDWWELVYTLNVDTCSETGELGTFTAADPDGGGGTGVVIPSYDVGQKDIVNSITGATNLATWWSNDLENWQKWTLTSVGTKLTGCSFPSELFIAAEANFPAGLIQSWNEGENVYFTLEEPSPTPVAGQVLAYFDDQFPEWRNTNLGGLTEEYLNLENIKDTYSRTGDFYWDSVSFMIDTTGEADGSTTFTDAVNGLTPSSIAAGIEVDIDQSWVGSNSILANGGHLVFADNDSAFDLGSGDFTLEVLGWEGSGGRVMMSGDGTNTASDLGWAFQAEPGGIYFYWSSNGNTTGSPTAIWSIPASLFNTDTGTDGWKHYAITREGNLLRAWFNGTELSLTTGNAAISVAVHNSSADFLVGVFDTGTGSLSVPYDGNFSNPRITKGVARYTSNFLFPQPASFAANTDVLVDGHVLTWSLADQKWLPAAPTGGGGGGGGAGGIQTIFATESQTAASGAATFTSIGLSGQLVQVTSSLDAWIVLYPTAAARTADAGRPYSTDPAPGSGVLAEFYVTAGNTILATPGTTYFNNDTTKTNAIYAAVRDQAGANVDSQVTLECYAARDLFGERVTSTQTTSSIADGVSADLTFTDVGRSGNFISIETDQAAWVTVYDSTASRTSDSGRSETTDPSPGSGVLAEVITTGAERIKLTPSAGYFNDESPTVAELYAKVVNKSGVTTTIQVSLTVVTAEA